MRARRVVVMVALATSTVAGCRLDNLEHLQLTKDNRLSFVTPRGRQLVKTPLTISWRMKGPVTGSYVVFVDRAPIGVGEDLKAVAKGDRACKRDPACPDTTYLNTNDVYPSTTTSVTIDRMPNVPDGVGDEQHEATVVLVDASGTRRSESAWYVSFRYPRRQQ